uniref:Uncharacterized protein n=1 Tax=Trichobilharzia regenti TaxID=157069 RepID=A0AA85K7X2_TRIRE|nr:unnamed protein product [Trichobilharzia regenti]
MSECIPSSYFSLFRDSKTMPTKEMDVRIKYPFKHFLKEGIPTKPVRKNIQDDKCMPVNTEVEDFRETSSGDEKDNVILAVTTYSNKHTKCFRKTRTVGRSSDEIGERNIRINHFNFAEILQI